jgi:hypothetical protein
MQQDRKKEEFQGSRQMIIGQERPPRTKWSGAIAGWKDESGEAASSDDAARMV